MIQVVPSPCGNDCNSCGITKNAEHDLRINTPNGSMTTVISLCDDCIRSLTADLCECLNVDPDVIADFIKEL